MFPWEERLATMPPDLQVLWKRYSEAAVRFDTKGLLDQTPRFEGLPVKPAENNVLTKFDQTSYAG